MKFLFNTTIVLSIISLIAILPAIGIAGEGEMINLKKELQIPKEGSNSGISDHAKSRKESESDVLAAPTLTEDLAPKRSGSRDLMITGAAVMGDVNAKVTLIEYSDYQCLYCARHFRQTMPKIIKRYIDKGKIKFVMRELPIPNLNLRANAASHAALCAGSQGKYWEMHDTLFNNQQKMSDQDIYTYASEIGLNTTEFNSCFERNDYANQIKNDALEARGMKVMGTPSFLLGLTDSVDPDKVKVTKLMYGARNFDYFAKEIDEILDRNDEGKPGSDVGM